MKCVDCGADLTHVKKKKTLITLYVCRVCGKLDKDYKKINDHEGECITKLKGELQVCKDALKQTERELKIIKKKNG